jgi:hypothetical protein
MLFGFVAKNILDANYYDSYISSYVRLIYMCHIIVDGNGLMILAFYSL